MLYSENDLEALELFFNKYNELPKEVQLGPGERIIDLPRFLSSHFEILRQGNGHQLNDVFYLRLVKVKEIILRSSTTVPPERPQ